MKMKAETGNLSLNQGRRKVSRKCGKRHGTDSSSQSLERPNSAYPFIKDIKN
jgi:hypothetical protein